MSGTLRRSRASASRFRSARHADTVVTCPAPQPCGHRLCQRGVNVLLTVFPAADRVDRGHDGPTQSPAGENAMLTRRRFLAGSTAALLGGTLPAAAQDTPRTPPRVRVID